MFEGFVIPISSAEVLTLATIIFGALARAFLIPWLTESKKKQQAERLLILADDILDDLALAFPDSKLMSLIDAAVEALIKATGIKREVAERVVNATIKRKEVGRQ